MPDTSLDILLFIKMKRHEAEKHASQFVGSCFFGVGDWSSLQTSIVCTEASRVSIGYISTDSVSGKKILSFLYLLFCKDRHRVDP